MANLIIIRKKLLIEIGKNYILIKRVDGHDYMFSKKVTNLRYVRRTYTQTKVQTVSTI